MFMNTGSIFKAGLMTSGKNRSSIRILPFFSFHEGIASDTIIYDGLFCGNRDVSQDRVAEKKITDAPDLVIDVASPSTAAYDRLTKYEKYAHAGITEYWIVKPTSHTVEVLVLEGEEYRSLGIFRGEQTLPSRIVPDLPVGFERFFV
jgi:Putative restriction endonuclease